MAKSSIIANCSSVFAKMPIDHHSHGDRPRHAAVSPKPSLRPNESGWISGTKGPVFNHQRNILDAKSTTVSFARPPNLAKAKTLSVESRECQNESLCATWPPAGKAGTILGEILTLKCMNFLEKQLKSSQTHRWPKSLEIRSFSSYCVFINKTETKLSISGIYDMA